MWQILVLLTLTTAGFCEIVWQTEIVDSSNTFFNYTWNTLALDTNGTPHIVYYEYQYDEVIYATRYGNGWLKEVVDSGLDLYFGFSLAYDNKDRAHMSYYGRDDVLDKTFVFYCKEENGVWTKAVIDSSLGFLGDWYIYLYSSLELDTSGFPGIAYVAWDVADSIHFIKYAHFNDTTWDLSIVEYDSAFANTQIMPTDWSPSLKYSINDKAIIAFYQAYNVHDTIKIGYFDDTLNQWLVYPAINMTYAAPFLSMQLSTVDNPSIAHGYGAALAYSWFDGLSWHTELTGTTMGWAGIQVVLDMNNNDNPHIAYLPEPLIAHPCYSYRQNGIWFNCGWIEPDTFMYTIDAIISYALDENDEPHVCYPGERSNKAYLKYAKGTLVGVEEESTSCKFNDWKFDVYPNPFHDKIDIDFRSCYEAPGINIYDTAGRLVKTLGSLSRRPDGKFMWDGKDKNNIPLPLGVYFMHIKTGEYRKIRKVILLR